MMRRQFLGMVVLAGAIGLVTGCGGGTVKDVKVTGSVVKDGKPIADVNVGFAPADAKKGTAKGGRTNAEGKFEIMMKPGNYTVTLTRMVDKKGNVPAASDDPAQDVTQLEA